ncbi:DUF4424 family protein [Akkermansia glycaniphila]|uniref:DUF4424 family protein n=1 Tax=Akkermansia glycaniphila TaxID=1679444 RepID=UPI001C02041A|nr:DUF4424 family protein [Akkermansia glycaniphila]MBT9449255.1 DUF4424 family protein [Akkermansia glycaniphila]
MNIQSTLVPSLLATLCFLMVSPVQANGGGWSSGVRSGAILPFDMEDISSVAMETEDLTIDLWTSGAEIRVTYLLRNTTDKPVDVRFGFPIESTYRNAVTEYSVAVQGERKTGYREVLQPRDPEEPPKEEELFDGEPLPETIQGWMVSDLRFAPKEALKLRIRCRVPYLSEYSGDIEQSRKMIYRLSPASVWHGPIGKGKVTVRARSVDAGDVAIAPAHRFVRRNHAWEWSFENLEPTTADDLEITLDPAEVLYDESGERVMSRKIGNSAAQCILPDGMAVSATSQAKGSVPEVDIPGLTFAPENLLIRRSAAERWYHVWGVPGKGRGESVTVTLPQPEKLAGFFICPGFGIPIRDSGLDSWFSEYGSVTEMEVVVNGTWKRMVRFEPGYDSNRWVSLEDCPLKAETVQFIIKDSVPGSVYDITCLSDLRFYRNMNRKPTDGSIPDEEKDE